MIEGGEDVKFIARRLIISAAEDIGLANPNALMLANETFSAVERVGWPESRIILASALFIWPLHQNQTVLILPLARHKNWFSKRGISRSQIILKMLRVHLQEI